MISRIVGESGLPDCVAQIVGEYCPNSGLRWQGLNFDGYDFSGEDFSECQLMETSLVNADMRGCKIGFSLWGARLDRSNLRGADLTKLKEMTNATLREVRMESVKLDGCDLINTDLDCAVLAGSTISNSAFRNCRMDGLNLSEVKFAGCSFDSINCRGLIMDGATGSIKVAGELFMAECSMNSVNLVISGYIVINDSVMENCRLEGDLSLRLTRVRMKPSILMGITFTYATSSDLSYCNMERVLMRDGSFDNSNFSYTNMKEAEMAGSIFIGADFSGANLTEANLESTCLKGACFRGANLSRARIDLTNVDETDFTDAVLDGAQFFGTNISRAIMTREQRIMAIKGGAISL